MSEKTLYWTEKVLNLVIIFGLTFGLCFKMYKGNSGFGKINIAGNPIDILVLALAIVMPATAFWALNSNKKEKEGKEDEIIIAFTGTVMGAFLVFGVHAFFLFLITAIGFVAYLFS